MLQTATQPDAALHRAPLSLYWHGRCALPYNIISIPSDVARDLLVHIGSRGPLAELGGLKGQIEADPYAPASGQLRISGSVNIPNQGEPMDGFVGFWVYQRGGAKTTPSLDRLVGGYMKWLKVPQLVLLVVAFDETGCAFMVPYLYGMAANGVFSVRGEPLSRVV